MVDPVAILAVLVIGIGFIIVVARFLESRANAQGPLFTKPPNQVTWVVALLFGLALIVGVYFTNLAAIRKIPIFVGERTLNEENNSGFTEQYIASWTSYDLQITTDGRVKGSFIVVNNGPSIPYTQLKDFLFYQVIGHYSYPCRGNLCSPLTLLQPVSDIIPLISEVSDKHSAEFQVDTIFQIPPLVLDKFDDWTLGHLSLTLTWVRVYKNEQDIYFQVFPGRPDSYRDNEIKFNQEPILLTGRFGYYSALPKTSVRGGRAEGLQDKFNYRSWILENLVW